MAFMHLYQFFQRALFKFKLFSIDSLFIKNKYKKHSRIVLVIGVGRSGTSWISRVLGEADESTRSIQEPIYPSGIKFYPKNDQTSIPFSKNKNQINIVDQIFSICTLPTEKIKKLFSTDIYKLKFVRDDLNFTHTLIKEVHCLLGAEAIIKRLDSPTLLVIRNIERTIDSQLVYQGFNRPVLINEFDLIDEDFLNRFFKNRKKKILLQIKKIKQIDGYRKRFIAKKSIVAILLNESFKIIAKEYKNVKIVSYEKACSQIERTFSKSFSHLGLSFGSRAKSYLENSQKISEDSNHPNSIYRNTGDQKNKSFKFLTGDEIEMIKSIKNEIGLSGE